MWIFFLFYSCPCACFLSCWLSLKNGAIWAFVAPALFVIVVRNLQQLAFVIFYTSQFVAFFWSTIESVLIVNLYSIRGKKQRHKIVSPVLNVSNLLSGFQVNIGILISVTRIISRISGESYKVHGDANAVKWVYLFSWSDQYSLNYWILLKVNNKITVVSCFVSRLTVKAVAVLLPILGISWIFGVLAVNTHSLPFLYIFAVFNSLQVSSSWWDLFFSWIFAPICENSTKVTFFSFSLGVLCLLVSLSSQLWGTLCFNVLICHFLWDKTVHTLNNQNLN